MPNPFNTQNNVNLNNIYKMLMCSNNPMAMFQQLAMQNSSLQPIVEMLRNNNPQDVFNQLCRQRGVDPQQFIKSITG